MNVSLYDFVHCVQYFIDAIKHAANASMPPRNERNCAKDITRFLLSSKVHYCNSPTRMRLTNAINWPPCEPATDTRPLNGVSHIWSPIEERFSSIFANNDHRAAVC